MSTGADIKSRIEEAVKTAQRQGHKARRDALRLMLAAIQQVEVDTRKSLSDEDVLAILDKLGKQRRESIEQFAAAGRHELEARERQELEIIAEFLPTPLDDAEIDRLIESAIADAGAASLRDMGKVMNALRPQMQGRADMSTVSGRVKSRLAG
ncbi:GatB/YqeY domain-containing protein [Acidihalobacter prosperus]|uniref:Glutamyl-tRNA amidotransferase n=1 Tax=Acidihalobacter prosperus TaxID=160660 RepID=A0A1A6C0Y2_9GAMM|nr:GatB/YqeY domain-containing protein [Acidihalobacter prosperus]OBS08209.1 glutamyl-tRNA amidotransferase [Acidihalobacter prosperus]